MKRLKDVKLEDGQNHYGLRGIGIGEDLSINRSTRQVSSTRAKNTKIPTPVIYIQNHWIKFDRLKGRRPKLQMGEEYSDIDQMVTSITKYSGLM